MTRKLSFLLLFVLLFAAPAFAQRFSYVYLQSDKETPIYVKLEGEMLPRYGQHYNIISRLAPGAINIEVLFQQNKFPPQKFTILVPEDGQRSLLLTRRDDTAWALYDLRQKFYILAGNIASEDRYNAPDRNAEQVPEPVANKRETSTSNSTEGETPVAINPVPKPVTSPNDEPKFIPDLELSREEKKPKKTPKKQPAETPKPIETPPPAPVENTTAADRETCGHPMSIEEFSTFYSQVLAQQNLEERLTFLMDSDQCPTPYQARIIARSLTGDAPRLRYMGRVVRRSAQPKSFLPLTNLFSDAENAEAFRALITSL